MHIEKKRCRYVCYIFVICLVLLACRIAYFSVIKCDDLSAWANSQYSYKEKITEMNYLLTDNKGKELLSYKNKYFIVIDPIMFLRCINEMDIDSIYALQYILRSYNEKYQLPNSQKMNGAKKIFYEVDNSTYMKLKEIAGLKGIYLYGFSAVDRSETWKFENILTNISDTKENKMKPENTLEMDIYKRTKNNKYPEIIFPVDENGNVSDGKISIPKGNVNVRLTLDKNVEETIEQVLQKYEYNQVGVIVSEADTGKLKAIVQKNNKESNINLGGIGDGFEPGSIFKILVEEAALESKTIKKDETFISKGRLEEEKHSIGELQLKQAFAESSNDVFSQIGRKTGINNILEAANKQGLFNGENVVKKDCKDKERVECKKGSKILNLNDERTGYCIFPQNSGDLNLISIGQNMKITPLQAIGISNTVANGGYYIKPTIIDAYIDDNNNVITSAINKKVKAVSEDTAKVLKDHMQNCIENSKGTARAALVQGLEMGGKTGTSTRLEPSIKDSKVLEKHSDGWFLGFFKSNEKYYSVAVIVKDINPTTQYASSTAVPVFRDIVENILKYL